MRQRYRAAVRHFRENPGELEAAWLRPFSHPHGLLFYFLSPDGHAHVIDPGDGPGGDRLFIGDPFLVAHSPEHVAWSHVVTAEVLKHGLPRHTDGLEDRHLVALARIQWLADDTVRCAAWRGKHPALLIRPWDVLEDTTPLGEEA